MLAGVRALRGTPAAAETGPALQGADLRGWRDWLGPVLEQNCAGRGHRPPRHSKAAAWRPWAHSMLTPGGPICPPAPLCSGTGTRPLHEGSVGLSPLNSSTGGTAGRLRIQNCWAGTCEAPEDKHEHLTSPYLKLLKHRSFVSSLESRELTHVPMCPFFRRL